MKEQKQIVSAKQNHTVRTALGLVQRRRKTTGSNFTRDKVNNITFLGRARPEKTHVSLKK